MAVLGVDIGGTKLLACLLDESSDVLWSTTCLTGRSFSPADARRSIVAILKEIPQGVGAIGVGVPGLVDPATGRVLSSVMLDGWTDSEFGHYLAMETGHLCVVQNDVNCAAMAELSVRGPAGQNMLFVAVGTGIGGAIVQDGRLWLGVSGIAGEIGHTTVGYSENVCRCGRVGCIGGTAGGSALQDSATVGFGSVALGPRPLVLAQEVVTGATVLGDALANAMNLLNLELVVLGGGVARFGEPYRQAVDQAFKAAALPEVAEGCRVELALAGYRAGAVGAAQIASETLLPGVPSVRIPIGPREVRG